ncbi:SIR2 family protein [Solimonas fluminis]|nr:SIR2 family protein [Solimonas fluminis]
MDFNADLVDDLARQKVVLFLGSGVSASCKTRAGQQIRQWEPFLQFAAGKIKDKSLKSLVKQSLEQRDYLMACDLIREALGTEWTDLLKQEYQQVGEPSALHKALVKLEQRIVVTTNFDKLLESAWEQFSGSATHFPQVTTKIDHKAFAALRDVKGKFLIKLHGSIDDPDSMVFTKSDYADRAFGNWAYNEFLRVLLLTHTFLFVGFSMTDPAISLLVEQYAQSFPTARPHYMLVGGKVHDRLIEWNKKLRRLYVLPYKSDNNHAELPRLLTALGKKASERRRELLAASNQA